MNRTDPFASASTQDAELLAQQLIEIFDQELNELDADILCRLRQARHRALAVQAERPRFARMEQYRHLTAGFASAVVVMLTMVTLSPSATKPSDETDRSIAQSELQVLASDADLDFLGSIDFLLWLEQQRV